jgi:hypothetical protein
VQKFLNLNLVLSTLGENNEIRFKKKKIKRNK